MKAYFRLSIRSALLLCGIVMSPFAPAETSPREKLLLDLNWKFTLKDPADAGDLFKYAESDLSKQGGGSAQKEMDLAAKRLDEATTNLGGKVSYVQPDFDDSQWQSIKLPHDWAIDLPFRADANTGKGSRDLNSLQGTTIGWYRRAFSVPPSDQGRTIWIEFGGAYRNTLVWLNGHCLGRMASGYTPFSYDVSKALNYGGRNELAARVDASNNEGWFYEGAGIYRHVWMIKTGPVHVAHWGTYVTSKVDGDAATVSIETTVENSGAGNASGQLTSTVYDEAGASVGTATIDVAPQPGTTQVVKQQVQVASPKLWSPETPHMYKLISQIQAGGAKTDEYTSPFGIRTVDFSAQTGFSLNGQHRFIKGVCNHQDFAGVGAAVPDRIQEYRAAMIKEIGADGWRMSHNPPNEEVLDECDRQGIMVMDENRRFGDYAEPRADLKAMLLRDRNHPCVVIWSLGNEEMRLQGSEEGAQICKNLQDEAHELDPSRQCTLAINHGNDKSGFTTVLDVSGINYCKLWGGMDRYHETYPDRKYIVTEEASTLTTRGLYFEDKAKGYLTGYDAYVPGWGSTAQGWWNFYQSAPGKPDDKKPVRSSWVGGAFVWTGFDYRGEPTPYGWPCISSHFGILDTCGFPKDIYYYYKAWWTKEPVLHLYPHWNWNQVSHRMLQVKVKTNLPQVEFWSEKSKLGFVRTKDGAADFAIYDDGDFHTLQVILDKSNKKPDPKDPTKTVETYDMACRQEVEIKPDGSEVRLTPLKPEFADLVGDSSVSFKTEEKPINICAESNLDEVELTVNGVSQGKQQVKPLHHLEWDNIPYASGSIVATAYKDGKLAKTETIETTNPASALRVTANRTSLKGDGEDVALVKVEALDDKGRFVPTANKLIHFDVKGTGTLIGVGNGDPSCHESDKGPDRSLFNGLVLGIVQTSVGSGSVIVTVSGEGLGSQTITVPVETATPRPFVP